MRAIVYTEAGDASVLHLVDRPEPVPGPGEVRVRIAVSGVNPTDWKSRSSTAPDGEQVPDQDGAGTVDAVGDGAPFAVGDRVWVWDAAYQRPDGTAQELVVLPARQVVPLPDAASFDLGAALGIPALTAHLALTAGDQEPAPLGPGTLADRTVLVAGGAGAVGHAAIELAVWAGAHVITTVSSPDKARLAAAAHVAAVAVRDAAVGDEVAVRVPQGFAYDGLYPETYAAAARHLASRVGPPRALVVGLRGIGAGLSAVVADTLARRGVDVRSVTVRPRGDRLDRTLAADEALDRLLRDAAATPGTWAVVVDEGPGDTGSSFAGTAAALAARGFDDGRIVEQGRGLTPILGHAESSICCWGSEMIREPWPGRTTPRSSVVRPSTCTSPPRAPRSAASPRTSASCAARCVAGSRSTGPARRPAPTGR